MAAHGLPFGTRRPRSRALIDGTLLIFNGSIAFVLTGLFLAAAGYATFATGVLPR